MGTKSATSGWHASSCRRSISAGWAAQRQGIRVGLIKFDKEPTRGEGNDVLSRHGRHLLARCDGGASNAAPHRNVTGCSTHVPEESTLTASTMTASRRLVQQKLSRARGADCGRTTQLGKERRGESVGSGSGVVTSRPAPAISPDLPRGPPTFAPSRRASRQNLKYRSAALCSRSREASGLEVESLPAVTRISPQCVGERSLIDHLPACGVDQDRALLHLLETGAASFKLSAHQEGAWGAPRLFTAG